VAISPDGRQLVSAGLDDTTRVWDLNNLAKEPAVLRGHEGSIIAISMEMSPVDRRFLTSNSMAISPDGRQLVSAGLDDTTRVWDLNNLAKEPAVLRGHEGSIHSVVISPDGHRLVSAGSDGTARVWDLDDLAKDPASSAAMKGLSIP
jgi:WD40 repeat protein